MHIVLNPVARVLVAACLFLSSAAHAQNALLDPGFGDGGLVRVDSQVGTDHDDVGIGICPGPGTTQVVVGTRIQSGMLMLARLREDGSTDPTYGSNGHVEYAIEAPSLDLARTLCLGNGRIDIAYTNFIKKVQLLRVGADGQPDPSFGNGGRLVIDPADLPGASSSGFTLHGMDRGIGSEILLSGEVGGSGIANGQATLIRVNGDGTLRDSRVFGYDGAYQDGGYIAAAAYAPNGDLWVGGVLRRASIRANPWFRQALNGVDLGGDVPVLGPTGVDLLYALTGGRMIRPGVMALSATVSAKSSGIWVPRLIVLRAGGESEVSMPLIQGLPSAVAGGLGLVASGGSGRQVVYGVSLGHVASYFARINVGDDASGDAIDAAFGDGGVAYVRVPGPGSTCAPQQEYARLSLWGDVPVFVGKAAVDCEPPLVFDVVVGRFAETVDSIFIDGFD